MGVTLAVDTRGFDLGKVQKKLGMSEGFDIGLEMSGNADALFRFGQHIWTCFCVLLVLHNARQAAGKRNVLVPILLGRERGNDACGLRVRQIMFIGQIFGQLVRAVVPNFILLLVFGRQTIVQVL